MFGIAFVGRISECDHKSYLENLDTDGRITLKCVLKEQNVRM